jgi:hypothetical protein
VTSHGLDIYKYHHPYSSRPGCSSFILFLPSIPSRYSELGPTISALLFVYYYQEEKRKEKKRKEEE